MGVRCFTHTQTLTQTHTHTRKVTMSPLRMLHFKHFLNEIWPWSCNSLLGGSRITVNEEGKNRTVFSASLLNYKPNMMQSGRIYSAFLSWLWACSQKDTFLWRSTSEIHVFQRRMWLIVFRHGQGTLWGVAACFLGTQQELQKVEYGFAFEETQWRSPAQWATNER